MTDRERAVQQIEQELGVLVRRARRAIRERARDVHPELQASTYVMLGYVRDHGPLRPMAMCSAFDLDKGSVSRQVQQLLDLGLLDRTPDPDDGRATLIRLSEDGRRRMDDVATQRRKLLDERLGEWSGEDLADFAAELARYNETLTHPEG